MTTPSPTASTLLREAARLFTRAQRTIADCCGSTSTQCHVLVELASSGPLTQSELGSRLVLEKSWVSRAIDTMVDRGLVAKKQNPNDGRSWQIALTAKGRRSANELNHSLDAHTDKLLAGLKKNERQSLETSLATLVDALRADTHKTGENLPSKQPVLKEDR